MKSISLKLIVVLVTCLTGLGAASLWRHRLSAAKSPNFSPSVNSEESEEYAVYSALIRQSFLEDGVKKLVIQNRTLFYANPDYLKKTTAEQRVEDMKRYCQSVDESALRDFESKFHQAQDLSRSFDLPVNYLLVNIDFDESSNGKAGVVFREFYKRYPDARGMISLSRIGFNKARDQAFLRVEFTFCPLCSHGGNVLLKKRSGQWKIVENFSGWVS